MDNKWPLVIIKQSKHGSTYIAPPSRLFVIDLTVHVDMSANPGPDVHLKPKYGKLNDHHLPCVINTLHSIQYSSGWLVHSSLPYASDMFLRNFNQLQMSDVTWGIGQTNSRRRHQINTRKSALNINEHLTSGQYPIQTRITTLSRSTRSYYKRSELENLIEIARTPMVPSFKPSQAMHFCVLNTRSLKNITTLVHDYVVDRKEDILALTATWLAPGYANDLEINETTPNSYAFLHAPRCTRGGGVAVIYRMSLHLKQNPIHCKFILFEHMDLTVKSVSNSIRVIVIYRPPPSKNNTLSESTFFSEFSTLLEDLVSHSGNVLLAGDFNFHVNDSSNTSAKKFLSLIKSSDYKNHVHDATHKKGHTLD